MKNSNTNNRFAIGFVSESNLPTFYEAAKLAKLDDATAPTAWAKQEIATAGTTRNIKAISIFLRERLVEITSNEDAQVAVIIDDAFLAGFPGISAEEFVRTLSPDFNGDLKGIRMIDSTTTTNALLNAINTIYEA
jgi:hypothetical protein